MHHYLRVLILSSFFLSFLDAGASEPKYGVDVQGAKTAYQDTVALDLFTDSYLDGAPDGPTPPTVGSVQADPSVVIAEGIYSSPYTGFRIRVPKISGEKRIHVNQALVSSRQDGTPITAHVVFRSSAGKDVYALVTTRLRDDRPKDVNSVLSSWEPKSAEEAAYFMANGMSIKRFKGPFGVSVVRSLQFRVPTEFFPYRISVDRSGENGKSIGLTRLVVMGEFFYEFSIIIYATPQESESDLASRAAKELDLFMGGLVAKATTSRK